MIIDIHAHAFPDKLAERAMQRLKENANWFDTHSNATISDTQFKMKNWGIDKFAILNIATNEKQQSKVNDFAIENNSEDI